MICHSISKGGYDTNSVLRVAPLILTPPSSFGTRTITNTKTGIQPCQEEQEKDDNDEDDILPWPALVHRLDSPTSGLLLVAKTRTATQSLSSQFEIERSVSKTYHAIVEGRPKGKTQHSASSSWSSSWTDNSKGDKEEEDLEVGRIESMVDGKVAITQYRVLDSIPTTRGIPITLVEFTPITGRKHQLRQHAAYELQCPIVGDTRYGSSWSSYLYLCSTRIAFRHPRAAPPSLSCNDDDETNDNDNDDNIHKKRNTMARIEVEISIPKRFHQFWERETKRYEGYQRWLSSEQNKS
jgi:23S rRNA-/tRNA-specific pseudouridylate synthase